MSATASRPKRRNLTIIAILTLFFLEPTSGLLTPNIANIVTAFDIGSGEATWVVTIASVVMIPIAIFGGAAAGRWIPYRPLALIGVGIYTIAGILPLFTGESFALLLVARALWGLGAGFNFTIANSLIAVTYQDERVRARRFGLGNVVFSLSAVVAVVVGGYLATISWRAPFYGFLIGVVAFVLVAVFLKEPERVDRTSGTRAQAAARGIPAIAWVPLVGFALAVVALYPIATLVSVVFVQADLGDAGIVGLVSSLMTVVGFFVSLVFGRLYGWLRAMVLPISLLVAAVGMLLAFLSSGTGGGSLLLYAIATGVVGAGLMGATVGTPMVLSTMVSRTSASLVQGLFAAALNLGGVLSSFYVTAAVGWLGGAEEIVQPVFLLSAIGLVVILIPLGILLLRAPSRRAQDAVDAPSEPVTIADARET